MLRMPRRPLTGSILMAGCLALAACSDSGAPEQKPVETEVPEDLQAPPTPAADIAADAAIGTPMEDRVAVIGLLNKRNNSTQDLEMKPGESRRVGNVIVRLQACEKTPPWELPKETGAFVQVLVQGRGQGDFARIFSGWLFKNSPSLNVVEHPIYDVWVKDCKMSFAGDTPPAEPAPAPARAASPAAPEPQPAAPVAAVPAAEAVNAQ